MRQCVAFVMLVSFAISRGICQESPSFTKQVRPFLAKYCSECHNSRVQKAGLNLDNHKSILAGSDNGPILAPGQPEKSVLVLSVEGKGESLMPPKKAPLHPKPAEIAVLRQWVLSGAKDDSGTTKTELPVAKARHGLPPPVSGLAFANGDLFVARGKEVLQVELPRDFAIHRTFSEPSTISALACDATGNRLAVAHGQAGNSATIHVHPLTSTKGAQKNGWTIPAHQDTILDLTFDATGKYLASASYDTRIQIYDANTGRVVQTLKDHSDAVYALAFHPSGHQLASVSADRAVKVWEVSTGKLLNTLSEATDWLYAVAWSPNGEFLAAGGVDKSIRLYKVQPNGIKILHSVFAHEGSVQKLLFSADSTTLYSLGQDRIAKAWQIKTMQETRIFTAQAEAVLAMAVSVDQKILALGRFDGVVALLDSVTGNSVKDLLSHKATSQRKFTSNSIQVASADTKFAVTKIEPKEIERGKEIEIKVHGNNLHDAGKLVVELAGVKVSPLKTTPDLSVWKILAPITTPPGKYTLQWKQGETSSAASSILVDAFPRYDEREMGHSARSGEPIPLPVSIVGKLDRAGDTDFYRFQVKAGQSLGIQILTQTIGAKLEPFLELFDAEGNPIGESDRGFLGHTFTKAGTYGISVRDREFRGGADFFYRIHLGNLPCITSIFPMGGLPGETIKVQVRGVFLDSPTHAVTIPKDAKPGTPFPLPVSSKLGTPMGSAQLFVGEFPEIRKSESTPPFETGTANGEVTKPGQADLWEIHAKKGRRIVVETHARRLGSFLDSFLEILDETGTPVQRAILRSVAKTHIAFRDHDNAVAGIRIEAWNDLATNDHILIGNELMKIQALPSHPDADCIFFNSNGQRLGFLDTTPAHHAMGSTLYKVNIHSPGTKLPPNGFPVFPVFYRNDDGGPGYGQDSRILFDPPADGRYQIRVSDSRGLGGENFGYRLTVRKPRPDFAIRFSPTKLAVSRGGALPIQVTADRIDGFTGPIHVTFPNPPRGFSIPDTLIEAGTFTTAVPLFAAPDAKSSSESIPLKLVARAEIEGAPRIHEAIGETPQAIDPGDLVTRTEESEIHLRPGGQTKLTVHIERRNGFQGRVPLEVKGLPHGVRVIDIGLNGILINANETRRVVVIEAESWVQPHSMPFVVLSRREGKNTEHAAKAVKLKIQ